MFVLVFPRLHRLTTPQSYRRVFRLGAKLLTTGLVVLHCENDCGHPRVGMAIARKHISKAVNRNRIKRAIREGFRQQEGLPSIDIVFISRPKAKTLAFNREQRQQQLEIIWEKLACLYEK